MSEKETQKQLVEKRQQEKAKALIARKTAAQNMLVTRHNSVNKYAMPNLSLNGHRIMAYYMACIDPEDERTWKINVPLNDFIQAFGLENYRINQLMDEVLALKRETEIKLVSENINMSVDLFYAAGLIKDQIRNQWFLQLYGTEAIKYYFKFDDGNFTKYKLSSVVAFTTTYQYILYNILRQNLYLGELTITIAELFGYMNVDLSKYREWKAFKNRVLLPTQKMICDFSDIVFLFERRKDTELIVFTIRKKADGWRVERERDELGTELEHGRRVLVTYANEDIPELLPSDRKEMIEQYKRLLGITRKPGRKQMETILRWKEQGVTDEMIGMAKAISIQKINRVTIEYVNGILQNMIKQKNSRPVLPGVTANQKNREYIERSHKEMLALLESMREAD